MSAWLVAESQVFKVFAKRFQHRENDFPLLRQNGKTVHIIVLTVRRWIVAVIEPVEIQDA